MVLVHAWVCAMRCPPDWLPGCVADLVDLVGSSAHQAGASECASAAEVWL